MCFQVQDYHENQGADFGDWGLQQVWWKGLAVRKIVDYFTLLGLATPSVIHTLKGARLAARERVPLVGLATRHGPPAIGI